jgi:hypothetical protein
MAYVTGHSELRRDASSPSLQRNVKAEGALRRPSLGNTGLGESGAGIRDVGMLLVLKSAGALGVLKMEFATPVDALTSMLATMYKR